jgi:ribonuclease BN (tRNA processing enzyme)
LLDLPVELRRQQHPGGSVGVRLGDQLAYVTDTAADSATVDFCRGVNWLLHETWITEAEARANPRLLTGHSSVDEVLHIAGAAAVRCLMPVHHQPKRTTAELETMITDLKRRAEARVVLLEEGQRYALDAY